MTNNPFKKITVKMFRHSGAHASEQTIALEFPHLNMKIFNFNF